MMEQPRVAVVVATRDRPARLRHLLDSLVEQTLALNAFEVVVVDDGSSPPAADLERPGLRLRVLRHERPRGPGAARNAGWRAATAGLIAFTDDDCRASPSWLEALVRVAEAGHGLVQGVTTPQPDEPQSLFTRTQRITRMGPQFETCNILYARPLLERLAGFDERFGTDPGGEDTDLAWRALAAGTGAALAPEAVVFHAVERIGPVGRLKVAARWSASMRIYREHPGTRVMLYRGLFWNVWHYLLLRSLLALVLPPWLRRPLINRHLAALGRRARDEGAPPLTLPASISFLVLHDIVELTAVVRGALRWRTPVI